MKRSLGTKLYYSIGEVAELTQLQPHTLRAWEKEFNCLRPKRMGKNRAYRERDIGVILLIQRLLYQERYSTRGAQLRLKNEPDLVRTASDNVAALLKGEVVLPRSANQSATASEQTEPAPQEARPSSESGSSTPVEPRRDTRVEALRQQVLTELRELISLLS
ncbi:MAG: MerR family transcriptional regulator [Candidatus Latescibacterota bacterium]|nr:MerR family transcriptional regulator [Candidatus Latescibacterota bacterium]